jgi:hypothetical protein
VGPECGYLTNVHVGLATGGWNSKRKSATARRGIAALGIFAILLQAVLFGWHHHPRALSFQGAPTVFAAAPAADRPAPVLEHHNCQICLALSHQSAAPVDFCAAMVPPPVPFRLQAVETVWAGLPSYALFRSRAPPRA